MSGLTEGEARYVKRLEAARRRAVREIQIMERLRIEKTINRVYTAAGLQAPYDQT